MANQVLLAPDILHELFLYLPQQDLLLGQRVCRTWNDIILSSTRLQATLFFHPGSEKIPQSLSPISELNPLLAERFPAFFDAGLQMKDLRQLRHNLGPWNSTDWFRGKSREEFPQSSPETKQRMAAYARAEASWRRMIPFRPLPEELQVCFGTIVSRISGTFKSLKFPNKANPSSTSQYPWLTFGLVYDIVEQAWFRGNLGPLDGIQFDYSYPHTGPLQVARNHSLIALRKRLPQKTIGGPGVFLMHLNRYPIPCGTGRRNRQRQRRLQGYPPEPEKYVYRDEFRSEGSVMANIRWDEEVQIPRT